MADKPDFSEITKKLKIGGLVHNVRSLISPAGGTPDPEEGDKIGHQLAELSLLMQELAEVNEEQNTRMRDINKLVNEIFEELKEEREAVEEAVHELEEYVEEEESEGDDEEEAPKLKKKTTAKKSPKKK